MSEQIRLKKCLPRKKLYRYSTTFYRKIKNESDKIKKVNKKLIQNNLTNNPEKVLKIFQLL